MAEPPLVQLPALAGGQAESWAVLAELAPKLGEDWLLIGGQMVFLHEFERGASDVRPTNDADVVVDLRGEPRGLQRVHELLVEHGLLQDPPSREGVAHRYRRGGASIDVLAPDNLGKRAQLRLGAGRTLAAPGTTQALRRSSWIRVELAESRASALIRRPDLVGALLGKAAAVTRIRSQSAASRAKHLRDLDSLAKLLGANDRATARLTGAEERTLRRLAAEPELTPLATASLELLARDREA